MTDIEIYDHKRLKYLLDNSKYNEAFLKAEQMHKDNVYVDANTWRLISKYLFASSHIPTDQNDLTLDLKQTLVRSFYSRLSTGTDDNKDLANELAAIAICELAKRFRGTINTIKELGVTI
jgi:hypothetical protein